MADIIMSSELKATLVRTNADDIFPIQMAQASLGADGTWAPREGLNVERFLKALIEPRHGVPFEHDIWTFFVEVPIFVARQMVKHRHASMNEMSGRYVQMLPKFYTAPENRPLINIGTKMKPEFVHYDDDTISKTIEFSDAHTSKMLWDMYQQRLKLGVAEEYARIILPLNTFTQYYWSVNTRALMSFLERRVDDPGNRVETHPQWEINEIARQIEDVFKETCPLTHAAFVAAGRVAP